MTTNKQTNKHPNKTRYIETEYQNNEIEKRGKRNHFGIVRV